MDVRIAAKRLTPPVSTFHPTVSGQSGVAHSGGQQGTSADLIILPNLRFVSAVIINMNYKNAEKLNRQIKLKARHSVTRSCSILKLR